MFSSENWFGASPSFYNDVATQSLRFDDGSGAELTRSPSSATNQKKYTLSCWVKRGFLGITGTIFSAGNSHTGSPGFEQLNFTSGDALRYYRQIGSVGNTEYVTTRLFRDTSAWYNIVVMMDASNTIAYIYVNGVRETSFSTENHPTNVDGAVNSTQKHAFGNRSTEGAHDFDGYLAEVNFLDGLNISETSGYLNEFGELKNGIWIPKEYTGSYGTNGFRLQFDQNGTGTGASDTVGADSANNNHFDSSGIVASDCNMPDSPENNWCLPSKIAMGGSSINQPLHQKGMLKITGTTTAWRHTRGTFPFRNGKWYFEGRISATPTGSQGYALGICDPALPTNDDINSGTPPHKFYGRQDGTKYNNDSGTGSSFPTTSGGTVIGIAIDMDNGKMWTSDDGTWYNNNNASSTLDPDNPDWTGITVGSSGDYVTNQIVYNTSISIVLNYGQDSSFTGLETATSNADANGNGTFHSAVPSGFLSLCSANLSEPTIGPNSGTNEQADNYFGILTWSGDNDARDISVGASGITGTVDFTPDLAWIKRRNGSSNGSDHLWIDTSRGVNQHKGLASNGSSAEGLTEAGSSWTNFGDIVSFKEGGFNGSASGTEEAINESGGTYVAWNWKANGGTTSSNTNGSITSTVQANTDAGLSIVTYTSNNSAGATIGHGLTVGGSAVAPQVVIIKKRSATERWFVWHGADPTKYIYLNENFAGETSNLDDRFGNNSSTTLPSSTVLTLGTSNDVNGSSGSTYVAYCFADVEGYSKFGSYTGNSDTDGAFVFTGFRPAFVLIKRTDTSGQDWMLVDSTRDTINPVDNTLFPSASTQELDGDDKDFLSNGFKHRSTGASENASGGTYIYMAFAEAPFKYANAR